MELIIKVLTEFDHPLYGLLITIIGSIFFGFRASRDRVNVIETLLYTILSWVLFIGIGCFFRNANPVYLGNESGYIWSVTVFSLAQLVNGLVLLIMFLLYCSQNPQKFIKNNRIVFKASALFGALFSFISMGLVFLGGAVMAFVVYHFQLRGILAFVDLIPLIIGFYLMGKSRQWVFRLMIYVIRKSLPENIQRNLVIEKGKIELEEEEETEE